MSQFSALFFSLLNFAILVFVLRKFLRAPVSEFFAKRHSDTHQYIEAAHSKRLQVEAELQALQTRQAKLDQEIAELRKQVETVSTHERTLIATRADEQLARISREAKLQVEQDALRFQNVLRAKILQQTFAQVETELQQKSAANSENVDASLSFLGRQLKEPLAQVGGNV